MNTICEYIPEMTIEAFAEANDLTMIICERPLPVGNDLRYYAHFQHCEVMDKSMLISEYGNGSTPEEAVAAYAKRINMGRIVVHAYTSGRLEIKVPRLKEAEL